MPRDRRISAPHDVLTTPSVLECGAEHLSILGFCLLGGVVNGSHALLLECLADGSVHHLVTVNGELLPEAALRELVPVLSDVLVTSVSVAFAEEKRGCAEHLPSNEPNSSSCLTTDHVSRTGTRPASTSVQSARLGCRALHPRGAIQASGRPTSSSAEGCRLRTRWMVGRECSASRSRASSHYQA